MLTGAALRLSLVSLVLALALGALGSGCPLTDDRRLSDAGADARDAGIDR